jgi:3-oxoacyl-[acyl-carrier protein] reductase
MSMKIDSLQGKTALITGGSKGIGRATCSLLAKNRVSVVVHYNKGAAAASELVESIEQGGGKAVALQADLGDPGSVDQLVKSSYEKLGPIDILVHNAGVISRASITDMTDELLDHSIDVHLKAAFYLTKALAPSMIERKWGRIIYVSSQAAFTGSANHAHYSAAKSGLLGLTFSIVKELGSSGITANLVSPGRILTDMITPHIATRKEEWMKQTPLKRFGKPEEVANVIVFLASDESAYISGANIHVNGGLVMG